MSSELPSTMAPKVFIAVDFGEPEPSDTKRWALIDTLPGTTFSKMAWATSRKVRSWKNQVLQISELNQTCFREKLRI
jgi:hypothetical protein